MHPILTKLPALLSNWILPTLASAAVLLGNAALSPPVAAEPASEKTGSHASASGPDSPGASARQQEALAQGDSYGQFMTLLEQPETLAPSSLRQADIDGKRIALYRIGDPRNRRYPGELYEAVANRITDKILAGGVFQVYECMQCRTVKVTIKDGQFSMARRAESNARLRQIADEIGVDGLLLWDAYYQYDRVVLDTRMMDADTGRIVWSKNYTYSPEWQRSYSAMAGLWGLEATRFADGSKDEVSVSRLMAYGAELLEPTSLARNFQYGLGLIQFRNTAQSSEFSFSGNAFYAKIQAGLDPLMYVMNRRDYANFNWYLALGDAYVEQTHNIMARTGVEVRFSQTLFMRLGGLYVEERQLPPSADSQSEADSEFGGASYEVLIGARF
jgi:hypothetical protein